MKYILEGSEVEVGKVLRENRIRVATGKIKFIPVASEAEEEATDIKDVTATDIKDVKKADTKTPRKSKK